jgi:hypothetical protein
VEKIIEGGDNEKGLAVTREGFAVPPVGCV